MQHLPFLFSDHVPLYVQLSSVSRSNPQCRPFRFEAAWLSHVGFKDLLLSSWQRDVSTPEALSRLRIQLKRWNKEIFGDVQVRKERLMNEIKALQDVLEHSQTDDMLRKEEELIKEFEVVLEQEEMVWFQKSREKWIALGDRNTSFFHTSTVIRRRKNRIEMLKKDDGSWVSDREELEQLAIEYYKRLYSMEDVDAVAPRLPRDGFTQIKDEDLRALNKPFSRLEIATAVKQMGKYKAPGPDGFQPVFYQECWDVVGDSVVKFVLDFFETGTLPPTTNDALIVLIAKVAKPEKITQFRPISLCNVLFKTITKTMVGRLKSVMNELVGPAQSSFIPGRLSMDNIVVVQEAVHSMRRKKGRKGWMLLKLDLEKAYDRIRWDFLEDTLLATGLSERWSRWIMQCVTGPEMNLLWNGERTPAFTPMRGLRQGDPLSPYLFVLCMERLCHLIDRSILEKKWKPISLSQGGPKLSHICFADDLILFAEASVSQICIIRNTLESFCTASGQKVSLEKSKIFFSENVSREAARLISEASGISVTRNLGKYLGMPVLLKRINKDTFGEVLERMTSRLAGWKSRTLSLAGRLTLTKAVLSSIPVHTMSTICLPKSTLEKLDQLARQFLWGDKLHMVAWDRVTTSKSEGGLGIRRAQEMNKALIAKLGWRLLQNHDSLWARLLRKKYKVGGSHDTDWLVGKSSWSSTWRSIAAGLRDVIYPGRSWVLGDGRQIHFWSDKWMMNKRLAENAVRELPFGYETVRIRDLWRHGEGWIMSNIIPYIPDNIRLELMSIVLDNFTGARDRLSWGESANGEFSVASAYTMLTRDSSPAPVMTRFYGRIWKTVTTERVKLFMWQVGNQALLTNVERYRRHLSSTDMCQVCKSGAETILHILRDCPAMAGIWARITPLRRRSTFFTQSLLEWLFSNLGDEVVMFESNWSTVFSIAIWWGWKWRCDNVFGNSRKCRDRIKFIKDAAKDITAAHEKCKVSSSHGPRVERMIGWTAPLHGWIKLNTDGASHGNPGQATAGGVLRDENGD